MSFQLQLIKNSLDIPLVYANELKSFSGLRTGVDLLDRFLFWQGLPCGDLVLFSGDPGCGATRLWTKTAVEAQKQGRWVAWINGWHRLCPLGTSARYLNFKKTLIVEGNWGMSFSKAKSLDLFFLLQEMICSRLFALISCPLLSFYQHQIQKIKKLARAHKVTIIFFASSDAKKKFESFFHLWSCVFFFQSDFLTIEKAQHRLTPFILSTQVLNEDFMSQLAPGHRGLVR